VTNTATPPLTPEHARAVKILARSWPGPESHRRNKAYLALCGGLLHSGLPQGQVEAIVEALAEATGDEEAEKRVPAVAATAAKLKDGRPVTGWPSVVEILGADGERVVAEVKHLLGLTINLADLAAHKQLPVAFLEGLGLHDLPAGGVGVPYCTLSGKAVVKKRTALSAGAGSYWPKGEKLIAYGEERLDVDRPLTLVEGESDCWTLWLHGHNALGLPGADTVARTLCLGHVANVRQVFVHQEPDDSGRQFVENVRRRLAELGWQGELRVVRLEGHKDPSDLHCADPNGFPGAWRKALEAAEPLDLTAAGSPQAPSWPDPVPLGEAPPVPAFPLEVLPDSLRAVPVEVALAMGCPVDYVAVPLLVTVGGTLGAARALEIKPGHRQRANLFAAVVGPPGVLKTPAQDQMVEPLREIEAGFRTEWKAQMKLYEAAQHAYEAELREWKKDREGEPPEKPERPALERLTVDDATVEALAAVLSENPRGVTLVKDELVGLVLALNQYREGGKGSDRQFYLSCWSGVDYTGDRRKTHEQGPLFVAKPFLAVVGGLTPERLPALRGDRPGRPGEQDGFLDRFLFSYPTELPAQEENWLQIDPGTLAVWAHVVERLRSLEMIPLLEGEEVCGWRPYVVRLTADGRDAWQEFTRGHAAEMNAEDFPDCLRGPWSKLRGYCGRLALIVHYLRWACGEVEGDKSDVDGESIRRAAVLVDYFKAHARKVYAVLDADPRAAAGRKLLRWVAQGSRGTFTRRDAYRALRGPRCRSVEDVEPVLTLLEKHGYVRALPSPDRHTPGRHPSPGYEAHPSLLGHNGQNGQNPAAEEGSVHCVQSVPRETGDGDEGTRVWEGDVP
jgi:hypothetical protein